MLREKETRRQSEYEIVLLDELVAQDHILRKIDAAVDFSFIHDLCKELYSPDTGRPAVEPELLFRMLFLGYLYGIKSETKLAQQVNENIAFKWFLGLKLTEKGPDHATISANRVRRFRDNNIAERIFDNILQQCIEKKLVGGNVLYTDSTHIKAKANKHRKALIIVEETPKEYMDELNAQLDLDRKTLKKKPFDHDDDDSTPKGGGKTRMASLTDPESGQQNRDGKPDGFYYSEHRTVDSKHNVIVNVHVEPANINDTTPLPEILREIEKRLGHLPMYMGLDAGYHNAQTAHLLEKNGIQGVIGYRRHTHKTKSYGKYRFKFDGEHDVYICPEKHRLYWKTTTREGYRQYFCDSKTCAACSRREACFGQSTKRRMVTRHVWQDALDCVMAFTNTPKGKRLYAWRKETIERSFAEAKENHGLRFARMLGIQNMREQCFLTAAVQNMKRLAKAFSLRFISLRIWKSQVLFLQNLGFVDGLRRFPCGSAFLMRWIRVHTH